MPNTNLGFDVFANDQAGRTFLKLAEQVDRLANKIDKLDRKRANPKVDVDTAGAHAKVKLLEQSIDRLGRHSIVAGAVALGSALAPVAAAAAGLAAALSAPVAAAAGGLTIYGFLTGLAVKDTLKQKKEIDEARKKLQGLEKGTDEYRQALRAYRAELNDLSPAQNRFLDHLDNTKDAFRDFVRAEGPSLFRPLNAGMRVLNGILPKTAPLVRKVSGALTDLINKVGKWTQSRSFDRFLGWFERNSGRSIRSFGRMLGNIAQGVAGIIGAFTPKGFKLLGWLEGLTERFARLGNTADKKGSPVQKFLNYLDRVSPKVSKLLRTLGRTVVDLLPPFARFGENLLTIANTTLPRMAPLLKAMATALTAVSEAFTKLPPELQTLIVGGGIAKFIGGRKGGKALGGGGLGALLGVGTLLGLGGGGGAAAGGKHAGSRGLASIFGRGGGAHAGRMSLGRMAGGIGLAALALSFGSEYVANVNSSMAGLQKTINGFAKGGSGGNLTKSLDSMFTNIKRLPGFVKRAHDQMHGWGKFIRSFETDATGLDDQVRRLDRSFANFAKVKPSAALRAFERLSKTTGKNFEQLAQLLPRTARALDGLGGKQAAAGFRGLVNTVQNAAERLRVNLIPSVTTLAKRFDLSREQAKRLRGALVDATTGGRKQENQLKQLARQLGLTDREVRQLARDHGRYQNAGERARAEARRHENQLKQVADKLGLNQRQERQLVSWLKNEEAASRDAGRSGVAHEKQLRAVAEKLGLNERQTRRLIRAYRDVPSNIKTKADFLTAEAERKRDAFLERTKGKFKDLGNQTYAIMVDGRSGHGRIPQANGSILRFRANGGVDSPNGHVAQIARGGVTRVWNEPETGGELYAPLALSKRPRSKQIMEQGARLMGGTVEWHADGGIRGVGGRVKSKVELDLSGLNKVVDRLVQSLRSRGGSVPATLAWARKQEGKPYIWGGVGPRGYDCSGFMSAITNHLMGRNPHSRLFTTATFPNSMFRRGKGIFSIGNSKRVGHMGGTLGGVDVEATGPRIRVGPGARGASHPLYDGIWSLKENLIRRRIVGGGGGVGGIEGKSIAATIARTGRSVGASRRDIVTSFATALVESGMRNLPYGDRDSLGVFQQRAAWGPRSARMNVSSSARMFFLGGRGGQEGLLDKHPRRGVPIGKLAQSVQGSAYPGRYGEQVGKARQIMNRLADGGILRKLFDGGGILKPGLTLAANNSGKDELILTNREAKALAKAFNLAKGMSRGDVRGEFKDLLKGLREHLGKDAPLVKRIERMADVTLLSMKKTSELRDAFREQQKIHNQAKAGMKNLASSTRSQFTGSLFGEGQGLTAFGTAKQQAGNAEALAKLLRRLRNRGLRDDLLSQIASSNDNESARELLKFHNTHPQAIRRLNRLRKQQLAAAKEVGEIAGNVVFRDEFLRSRERRNRIERAINRRNRRMDRRIEDREDHIDRTIGNANRRGGFRDGGDGGGRDRDQRRRQNQRENAQAIRAALDGVHIVLRDGGENRKAQMFLRTGVGG